MLKKLDWGLNNSETERLLWWVWMLEGSGGEAHHSLIPPHTHKHTPHSASPPSFCSHCAVHSSILLYLGRQRRPPRRTKSKLKCSTECFLHMMHGSWDAPPHPQSLSMNATSEHGVRSLPTPLEFHLWCLAPPCKGWKGYFWGGMPEVSPVTLQVKFRFF